ncbi:MAG TPA: potassium channel family protein [Ktedonobacteraceae bacterium]
MRIVAIIISLIFIFSCLRDAFETIVLPRKVSRRFSLSNLFYSSTWMLWSMPARKMRSGSRREFYLSYFGPLSLLLLLIIWAVLLVVGFAFLYWGTTSPVLSPKGFTGFGTYLYMSGTTFITLGLGDVTPLAGVGRFLVTLEAGTGFGFLALVIGYVPVIYQAFSRRETDISLLDARAGSPASASELLRRHSREQQQITPLVEYLHEWETWSAQILESHLSYPVLMYYRSLHERQSWLAALTTILDTSALLIVGFEGISIPTARFTFAMARHAAVDLAQVFETPPPEAIQTRLTSADFTRLRDALAEVGLRFRQEEDAEQRLGDMCKIYEPFVQALADHLLVNLPPWVPASRTVDDWQTSAWDHFAQWSPEKLEEITHIIVDHRKKVRSSHEEQHQQHTSGSEEQHVEKGIS